MHPSEKIYRPKCPEFRRRFRRNNRIRWKPYTRRKRRKIWYAEWAENGKRHTRVVSLAKKKWNFRKYILKNTLLGGKHLALAEYQSEPDKKSEYLTRYFANFVPEYITMKYGASREVYSFFLRREFILIFLYAKRRRENLMYTYNLYATANACEHTNICPHIYINSRTDTHSCALMKRFNPLRKCFSDIFSKH